MKKAKILEEFWYANIRPFEDITPPDPLLVEKVTTARSALFDALSADQRTLWEIYESECDVISMEAAKNAFVLGFQLGAKFMVAINDS